MPIDGLHTYTIDYRLRRSGATTSHSISRTQRWPVTRTNAQRQSVLAVLGGAAPVPGTRDYTWIRVEPPVPPS